MKVAFVGAGMNELSKTCLTASEYIKELSFSMSELKELNNKTVAYFRHKSKYHK